MSDTNTGNGEQPRASDYAELKRAVESAHRRIDTTDRDLHVLKSQMTDVRSDVKSLTTGQQDQNTTLAGMAQTLKFLEEAERARQKQAQHAKPLAREGEGGDRKGAIALIIGALVAVIYGLLSLLERFPF